MNKGKEPMSKNKDVGSSRVYIAYSEERNMYYVGETRNPYEGYATHRACHHRKIAADFPASEIGREREDEELALFQFCEAMGLPLENKHRLRWPSKRRD
jgi:predicted GIY-YIG superfamily endonuclease